MRLWICFFILIVILLGCSQSPSASSQLPRPPATIAPFFTGTQLPIPTLFIPTPVHANAQPPSSDAAELQATAQRDETNRAVSELTIFDDQLVSGWTLEDSWGLHINQSPVFVAMGRTSLEVFPLEPFAGILFSNSQQNARLYPRSDVVGIRFSISGGDNYLTPESLIVKVMGSNLYPYFLEGDQSVRLIDDTANRQTFDEVGLSRLGLRRDLDPGEWAEVELWLDGYDLTDYTYVTAINVMNAPSYMNRFYIDNVRLLVRRR